MSWTGKIAGLVIGSLAGPVGAAVGLFLGHQFDRGMAGARRPALGRIDRVFFEVGFGAMGHLAKADGRVSEAEIHAARALMNQMRLGPAEIQEAIGLFSAGKEPGWPLDAELARLNQALGAHQAPRRAFLEMQMALALANGYMDSRQRELLWRMAAALELSRVDMAQVEAMLRLRRGFGGSRRAPAARPPDAADAYRVLGLEPGASDAEVKLAYRRLMNQHHPDKLRARGMPESMIPMAEAKTREIRAAWDTLRAARGLR